MSKEEVLRLKRRIDELESRKQYGTVQNGGQRVSTVPPGQSTGDDSKQTNAMMGLMEEEHQDSINLPRDSSATSFMKQIRIAMNPQFIRELNQTTQPVKEFVRPPAHIKSPLDYLLPSRQRADHLMQTYWRLVHSLYPFLHKVDVLSTYQKLWTGEDIGCDAPTFVCLLNIIFSIACILDPTIRPEERESSADVFYQRARELLGFDFMKQPSTLTVQCLLVLGQYLQSTNDPQQCWIFIGLAIRIAQSIGLDLPSTSAQAPNLQQRELLRRVWHGCVLMDRALAMTLGRPAVITPEAAASVPWPLAHSNNRECTCLKEMCILDHAESEMHFFIESLKLYELMNEILRTLYDTTSRDELDDDPYEVYFGGLRAKAAGDLLEMDRKLCIWSRNLPIHLRCNPGAERAIIHERQANVLWLRYRHVQILLFRPILSRFCSHREDIDKSLDLENTVAGKMAFQLSVTCVKIALEAIEFFTSRMEGKLQKELDDILPAWWYSIFYIYTAAAVIVAARLHESIAAEITEEATMHAWRGLMKALGHFQNFSKHAKRCLSALVVLDGQVQQQHQQQRRRRPPSQDGGFAQARNQYQGMSLPLGPANSEHVFSSAAERQEADENMVLSEATDAHNNLLHRPGPSMPDAWGMGLDYPYNAALSNTSEFQLGLGDMSWLNSIPLDFYSD